MLFLAACAALAGCAAPRPVADDFCRSGPVLLDAVQADARLSHAVFDGMARKAGVVLLARKTLFLSSGDDIAVAQQGIHIAGDVSGEGRRGGIGHVDEMDATKSSGDGGNTWTQQSNATPNILGWAEDGTEKEFYSDASGKSGGQKEKLAYTILASALAYQFGLEWGAVQSRSFRFVVIDEAFEHDTDTHASDDAAGDEEPVLALRARTSRFPDGADRITQVAREQWSRRPCAGC